MTDHFETADIAEKTDPAEPMENAEANDPTEPIDRHEPIDPMERTEPFDPIDRSESSDHSDHRDRAGDEKVTPQIVAQSEAGRDAAPGDGRPWQGDALGHARPPGLEVALSIRCMWQ